MAARWESGILTLEGEFDLANEMLVRSEIARAVAAGAAGIEIDMTAVTFADSTTLACLLDATRVGLAVTVRPSPFVARTLKLLGLDEIITIAPTN